MPSHYRPPRSGKRSLATALLAAFVAVGGVFFAIGQPSVVMPAAVMSPESAQRHTKSAAPDYAIPSPMPKAPEAVSSKGKVSSKARTIGHGIYKCEDEKRQVTYSQFPCDDPTIVDTRPTSAGFGESWQVTVKHR